MRKYLLEELLVELSKGGLVCMGINVAWYTQSHPRDACIEGNEVQEGSSLARCNIMPQLWLRGDG